MIAFADPAMVDASTMVGSFMQSYPHLVKLLNVIASLSGLAITLGGLYKFTQVPAHHENTKLIVPLMWVLSGVALFNLASSMQTMLVTLFGSGTNVHNVLAYQATGETSAASKQLIQALILCARLYGMWCAIRGLMTLRHIGDAAHRDGNAFKSGMMKLVFGVLLFNIVQSVNAVSSTFGWGNPLS